jgi:hypothetical protein
LNLNWSRKNFDSSSEGYLIAAMGTLSCVTAILLAVMGFWESEGSKKNVTKESETMSRKATNPVVDDWVNLASHAGPSTYDTATFALG